MADSKISALSAVTSVASGDALVLARSSTTKRLDAKYLPGFELDYAEHTAAISITATSEASPTNVVSGAAVTYDGSTAIIIEFFAPISTTGASAQVVFNVWDGSSDIGRIAQLVTPSAGAMSCSVFGRRKLTPSAAAHTYHIKAWRVTANGSVTGGAGGSAAYMPLYMRITKA